MSDFGSMITVYRADGSTTTPADLALVKRHSKDLVIGTGYRISDYADFELRFGTSKSASATQGIMVGLTSYLTGYESQNDGLSDDALIARDGPLAEQFAEELGCLLGSDFVVKWYAGGW